MPSILNTWLGTFIIIFIFEYQMLSVYNYTQTNRQRNILKTWNNSTCSIKRGVFNMWVRMENINPQIISSKRRAYINFSLLFWLVSSKQFLITRCVMGHCFHILYMNVILTIWFLLHSYIGMKIISGNSKYNRITFIYIIMLAIQDGC